MLGNEYQTGLRNFGIQTWFRLVELKIIYLYSIIASSGRLFECIGDSLN